MDLLSARQKLVASNIANADTPGYQTRDIDFQSEYQNAMGDLPPAAINVQGLKTKPDGNNVDMDVELGDLNRNSLMAAAATQILALQIAQLRSAITGR